MCSCNLGFSSYAQPGVWSVSSEKDEKLITPPGKMGGSTFLLRTQAYFAPQLKEAAIFIIRKKLLMASTLFRWLAWIGCCSSTNQQFFHTFLQIAWKQEAALALVFYKMRDKLRSAYISRRVHLDYIVKAVLANPCASCKKLMIFGKMIWKRKKIRVLFSM